jgi:hypothetical protein
MAKSGWMKSMTVGFGQSGNATSQNKTSGETGGVMLHKENGGR